jgi:outer membrane receptor protein involved in Fe transport
MKQFLILLPILLNTFCMAAQTQSITVSGTLTDAKTGETLIGASVVCTEYSKGTLTNTFGFYSIDIPANALLHFSYLGYENQTVTITPKTIFPLNIQLHEKQESLHEVVVTATPTLQDPHLTGVTKLDMKQIASLPAMGGEKDLVKVLQLMPGIKKENDGNAGMLVRGGSGDQNLVLLDDAPVYNASHLLGFFSVFNSDAVKDVTLQKGGFTANHGGRLSSVLDVRTKDGNMKKTEVNVGVGLLSAHASIEGPIITDKMSYIISGRRTYIDHMYKLIGSSMPFYFYDLNGKIHYRISEKDKLFLSVYRGKDILRFGGEKASPTFNIDFANKLRNTTSTLRWNHIYDNQKLFQRSSLIYTQFYYQLTNQIDQNQMQITSSIHDWIGKLEYDYFFNNQHHFLFGGAFTQHYFSPNKMAVTGSFNEAVKATKGQNMYSQEMAIYAMNNHTITSRLSAQYGIRLSGAHTQNTFYINPEPRLNISYQLTSSQVVKIAYSHMSQYINMVSGASTMPSDVWYPVTDNIKPQRSKQVTVGYTKSLPHGFTFSAESYLKWQQNVVEFREGSIVFSNDNIEQDIVQGKAKAYGIELLLHKQSGKWNGWTGYTLASANASSMF